jgi:hypothetical protein
VGAKSLKLVETRGEQGKVLPTNTERALTFDTDNKGAYGYKGPSRSDRVPFQRGWNDEDDPIKPTSVSGIWSVLEIEHS